MAKFKNNSDHLAWLLWVFVGVSSNGGTLKQQQLGSPATHTYLWGSTIAYGRTVRGAQLALTCGGVPHLRRQRIISMAVQPPDCGGVVDVGLRAFHGPEVSVAC
jgi:hypothetical protein